MPSLKIKQLKQAGDTLVEVLMALAILGTALSMGYGAASSGLRGTQQAEEHSQATGIIQTQLELIRVYADSHTDIYDPTYSTKYTNGFCMDISGLGPVPLTGTPTNLNDKSYPAACQSNNQLYYIADELVPGTDTFRVTIRWNSINHSSVDMASMAYRTYPGSAITGTSTTTTTTTTTTTNPPPELTCADIQNLASDPTWGPKLHYYDLHGYKGPTGSDPTWYWHVWYKDPGETGSGQPSMHPLSNTFYYLAQHGGPLPAGNYWYYEVEYDGSGSNLQQLHYNLYGSTNNFVQSTADILDIPPTAKQESYGPVDITLNANIYSYKVEHLYESNPPQSSDDGVDSGCLAFLSKS